MSASSDQALDLGDLCCRQGVHLEVVTLELLDLVGGRRRPGRRGAQASALSRPVDALVDLGLRSSVASGWIT
jgi:hypothetical protein